MAKKNKPIVTTKWAPASVVAEKDTVGEVITVPNQTQSIREILFRNTAGMTYDNYKTPYYEDQATFSSQPLNKIQEMEPVEKLQYLAQVKAQVDNLQQKISAHEAQKAEEAKAEAVVVDSTDENAQETNTEADK